MWEAPSLPRMQVSGRLRRSGPIRNAFIVWFFHNNSLATSRANGVVLKHLIEDIGAAFQHFTFESHTAFQWSFASFRFGQSEICPTNGGFATMWRLGQQK
jgi:hypothetical protein